MSVNTRRRFVAGALVATASPVLHRTARAQTAVKIGTAVLGDYSMAGPVIVALERGFFKSEGLAAEFIPFRGGPDLLKAVMAGECLVGISGSTDILVFREAGSPIKMIATHTEGNHFTLNVAPDVQRLGDLKGKSVGVTRVGATTWVFARMLARKEGWDPDRDVQIVGLGGLDAQLAALARREIAAYVWGDGGAVTGDAEVDQSDPVRLRGGDPEAGRRDPEDPAGAVPRDQADARHPEGHGRARVEEARLDTGGGARRPPDLGPVAAGRRPHRCGGARGDAGHAARAGRHQEEAPARRALHARVHAGSRVAACSARGPVAPSR